MSLLTLPTISLRHPVRTGTRLAGTAMALARSAPKVAAALPEITLAAARWAGTSARNELSRRFGNGADDAETAQVIPPVKAEPAPEPAPEPASTEAVDSVLGTIDIPQDVSAAAAELESGATLAHDELPLPDYDHLTLGSLRARVARLSPAELLQLREYEQAHANRLSVVLLFDNRLAKVTGSTGQN